MPKTLRHRVKALLQIAVVAVRLKDDHGRLRFTRPSTSPNGPERRRRSSNPMRSSKMERFEPLEGDLSIFN